MDNIISRSHHNALPTPGLPLARFHIRGSRRADGVRLCLLQSQSVRLVRFGTRHLYIIAQAWPAG